MEAGLEKLKEVFRTEIQKREFEIPRLQSQADLVPKLQEKITSTSTEINDLKEQLVVKNSEVSELKSQLDTMTEYADMVTELKHASKSRETRAAPKNTPSAHLAQSGSFLRLCGLILLKI